MEDILGSVLIESLIDYIPLSAFALVVQNQLFNVVLHGCNQSGIGPDAIVDYFAPLVFLLYGSSGCCIL